MTPPRCAFGASPPGGRRQRPGKAGSAAAAWFRYRTIAVVAAVVAVAGCSKPPASASYFPLEAGRTWRYEVRSEWENNTTDRENIVITADGEVDTAQHGKAFHRRSADGVDYWLKSDDTGVYRVAVKYDNQEAPTADQPPRYVLKQPLAVGTNWQASTTSYLLRRNADFPPEIRHTHKPVLMTYRIEALGQTVDTRAGSFQDCIRVQGSATMKLFADPVVGFKDMPLTTTEWYCRGVGLVKLERQEPTNNSTFLNGGKLVMELTEWP